MRCSAVVSVVAAVIGLSGCLDVPLPARTSSSPLAMGELRELELYAMRFDVDGIEEVITKADILSLPEAVRESLWLYDLDLTGDSGTPRLLDNALAQIRELGEGGVELSTAERNMVGLLNMTPDNANLSGSAMAELLELSPKVGISAAKCLADAMGIRPEESFLTDQMLTQAVLEGVVGTHPAVQWRPGPSTAENPEGLYPVAHGHIPVTLEDAASDMVSLSTRMGRYEEEGRFHPGFMTGTTRAQVLSDDFKMILKASANALPFKGVDLSLAEVGSVTSIGRDGRGMFDFGDPDWLRIEGLSEQVVVEEMVFQIIEYPEWVALGTSPLPAPRGDSEVWRLPRWTLERVVAEAAFSAFESRAYDASYYLGGSDTPIFSLSIDKGWFALSTRGHLGSPPRPLYLWDLMLEVAQLRLHDGGSDGESLAEGQGDVRFSLRDVPVGIETEQIAEAIRRNLEEDASQLLSTATVLLDQSAGAPDFFYFRAREDGAPDDQGDWLWFVDEADIPLGSDGRPSRDYASYRRPGFFADSELGTKLSSLVMVNGDAIHEKVRINPGDVVFAEDDEGQRFRIEVLPKPSQAKLRLAITRVL